MQPSQQIHMQSSTGTWLRSEAWRVIDVMSSFNYLHNYHQDAQTDRSTTNSYIPESRFLSWLVVKESRLVTMVSVPNGLSQVAENCVPPNSEHKLGFDAVYAVELHKPKPSLVTHHSQEAAMHVSQSVAS
jgi:hypothetical protein